MALQQELVLLPAFFATHRKRDRQLTRVFFFKLDSPMSSEESGDDYTQTQTQTQRRGGGRRRDSDVSSEINDQVRNVLRFLNNQRR
jgi:hypothetical protein